MMKTRVQRRRGGAAVELAIMMVFLVPTFMYFLFLQDLLWYKLEMQETIVSTPWDYNYVDWNKFQMAASNVSSPAPPADDDDDGSSDKSDGTYDPSKKDEKEPTASPAGVDNVVNRNSRRTYCDHTSAYDSYDGNYDCKDQHHHTNHTAHQCWLTKPNARQVTCSRERDTATASSPLSAQWNNTFNAGGYVKCDGRLGVTNYFLPNKFFDFWAKPDVTKLKRFTGAGTSSAHADAKGTAAGDAIVFAAQTHSLMQDPWAVNRPADINPDEGNMCIKDPDSRFRARMKPYWYIPAGVGLAAAAAWHGKMGQEHLLSPLSMCDGIGDLLHSPPLAWKKDHDRKFGKHHTSGWVDQRHQQSHGARTTTYFAQQNGYY